jgi:hypothetical protein
MTPRGFALLALLIGAPASAAPPFPMPKLDEVMRGSLTDRARIRYSRLENGVRVTVTVAAGRAERVNTNMSPQPAGLKYDLDKNRELERAIKAAHLGRSNARAPSSLPQDRTLEILAEGPTDFVVVGTWVWPQKVWKKKKGDLYDILEPMFDVQPEVFGTQKTPEK